MEDNLCVLNFISCLLRKIPYFFIIVALLSITLCVFAKYKRALVCTVSVLLVEVLVLMGLNASYDLIGYDPLSYDLNQNFHTYPFLKGAKRTLKEIDLQLPHIASVESHVTPEGNNMAAADNRYEDYHNIVWYDVTFKQTFSDELIAELERLSANDEHWSKKTSFRGHVYYDYSNRVADKDWCITHVEIQPNDNSACVVHYIKNGFSYSAYIGTPDIIIIFILNALTCILILLLRGLLLIIIKISNSKNQ